MAGFAAGFGQAFTQSYNKAKDRRHDKEQDQLRMQFQEAMDQKQAMRDREKEDRQALREIEKYARDKKAQEERDTRLQEYGQEDLRLSNELASGRDTANWERSTQKSDEDYQRNRADSKEDKKADFETDVKKLEIGADLRKKERENDLTVQQKVKDNEALDAASGLADMYGLSKDEIFDVYKAIKTMGPGAVEEKLAAGARPPKTQTKSVNPAQEQTNKLLNPTPMSAQTEPPMAPPAASEALQVNPGWTGLSTTKDEKVSDLNDPMSVQVKIAQAEQSGDTKRVEFLKDHQRKLISLQNNKIAQEAEAKGERFVPRQAVVVGEDGKSKYVPIHEDPNNPGVFVDSVTNEPIKIGGENRFVDKNEIKARSEVVERLNEPISNYEEKVDSYQRLRSNYESLGELLTKNPDALTKGGELAASISRFGRDAQGVLNLLANKDIESLMGQTSPEEVDTILGRIIADTRDPALANAVAEAKLLQIAFDKTRMQYGAKASNQEFDKVYQTVVGDKSRDTIMQLGEQEMAMEKTALDAQYNRLIENPLVRNYMETYRGVNPIETLKPVSGPSEQSNQVKTDEMQMPDGTDEEKMGWYNSLPKGAKYKDPDGNWRIKGGQ